jgi:AcrR family transcriptional regulator
MGVAAVAGVSAPTVIHRFGSKEALFLTAPRSGNERVRQERGEAPAGDVWKILRRDHRLSRNETEAARLAMVSAVLEASQ